MSKAVKALVTEDIKTRYSGMNSLCVVDLTGMNVQEQESLRSVVRKKGGRVEVVKNSMARRAFVDTELEPLGGVLDGPCALVSCEESLIEVAKVLVQAAEDFEQLKLKQAIFDGDPRLLTVEELSKMRGKRELMGEVVMLVSSPGRAIAGCLSSPQAKVAGCLKTIADRAA